jgi:outer membrane protein TolC
MNHKKQKADPGTMSHFTKLCMLLILPVIGSGQTPGMETSTLSPAEFVSIVKKYHPVVKQAGINIEKASAATLIARGMFDPSFYLKSNQKTFDGKNYYLYTNAELKVPTWYGIEVSTGIDNNGGQYLNRETTPGKTSYLGVSLPLVKNLVMDGRRAALEQAKLLRQQSEVERKNTVNDLLNEAMQRYWNWVRDHQVYRIYSEAVKVNEERLQLVRIGYRQGDRPAVDTIEALAQLQSFQFLENDSWVKFKNSGVALSAYLWLDNNQFYQLGDSIKPEDPFDLQGAATLPTEDLQALLETARRTHPKLQLFNYKLQVLEVERQLKFQSLLPAVNLKVNLLNRGLNVVKGVDRYLFENNNKFGIDFGIPLRLSEGRGAFKMAKLKIQETNLDLFLQQQEIENKIRYYYNELFGLQKQISIYNQMLANYQALYRAENIRFRAGESTLFLVNARENKVLETRQKVTELTTKLFITQVALRWAAGQLN